MTFRCQWPKPPCSWMRCRRRARARRGRINRDVADGGMQQADEDPQQPGDAAAGKQQRRERQTQRTRRRGKCAPQDNRRKQQHRRAADKPKHDLGRGDRQPRLQQQTDHDESQVRIDARAVGAAVEGVGVEEAVAPLEDFTRGSVVDELVDVRHAEELRSGREAARGNERDDRHQQGQREREQHDATIERRQAARMCGGAPGIRRCVQDAPSPGKVAHQWRPRARRRQTKERGAASVPGAAPA